MYFKFLTKYDLTSWIILVIVEDQEENILSGLPETAIALENEPKIYEDINEKNCL
jgi:hypothetical protein